MKMIGGLLILAFISCQPSREKTEVATESSLPMPDPQPSKPAPTAGAPDSFVGLTETAAVDAANRMELPHRIVERDGRRFPVTRDFRPNRLNFVIEKGMVVRVTTG